MEATMVGHQVGESQPFKSSSTVLFRVILIITKISRLSEDDIWNVA
jgi:hypothetical protein